MIAVTTGIPALVKTAKWVSPVFAAGCHKKMLVKDAGPEQLERIIVIAYKARRQDDLVKQVPAIPPGQRTQSAPKHVLHGIIQRPHPQPCFV